jgi:uncharacterized protein (TIGR00369 family)
MSDEIPDIESCNQRLKGIFAPWIQQLDLRIVKFDQHEVIMRMPFDEKLCRIGGIVCGQSLMALIDTCMVFVCYSGLGRFCDVTTVSQNTSFMRPVIGQDVIATGRVVKAGRTLVFGEVSLALEGDERTVCSGTSTYAVIPPRA